MHTTELIEPQDRLTVREMITEVVPLVGAVAGYGPPVISVAGPWLLLALILSPPFAVLLTLIAVMLVAATIVVALAAAIRMMLVAPYRLMRRRRSVRAPRPFAAEGAARLVPVGSPRVAS